MKQVRREFTIEDQIERFGFDGFDSDGFGSDGFDSDGLNAEGFDFEGYDYAHFDIDGFDRDGNDYFQTEEGFDSIKGRGKARKEARRGVRKDKRNAHKMARQQQRADNRFRSQESRQGSKERRLQMKDAKEPTPLVDQSNNAPNSEQLAAQKNIPEDQYLEETVAPYQPQLQAYINKAGYQSSPTNNLAEDATRYVLARNERAINMQEANRAQLENENMTEDEIDTHLISPDEIEEQLIREDMEEFGDSFDSFFPVIFNAAKKLGQKGISAIKANQEKKINAAKEQAAREATLQEKLDAAEKKVTEGAKKYAPYIIGAIIVIALVCTILYMNKKKKVA